MVILAVECTNLLQICLLPQGIPVETSDMYLRKLPCPISVIDCHRMLQGCSTFNHFIKNTPLNWYFFYHPCTFFKLNINPLSKRTIEFFHILKKKKKRINCPVHTTVVLSDIINELRVCARKWRHLVWIGDPQGNCMIQELVLVVI